MSVFEPPPSTARMRAARPPLAAVAQLRDRHVMQASGRLPDCGRLSANLRQERIRKVL